MFRLSDLSFHSLRYTLQVFYEAISKVCTSSVVRFLLLDVTSKRPNSENIQKITKRNVVSTDANSGLQDLNLCWIEQHTQKIILVVVKCWRIDIIECDCFSFLVTVWGSFLFPIAQAPYLKNLEQFFIECSTSQTAITLYYSIKYIVPLMSRVGPTTSSTISQFAFLSWIRVLCNLTSYMSNF